MKLAVSLLEFKAILTHFVPFPLINSFSGLVLNRQVLIVSQSSSFGGQKCQNFHKNDHLLSSLFSFFSQKIILILTYQVSFRTPLEFSKQLLKR